VRARSWQSPPQLRSGKLALARTAGANRVDERPRLVKLRIGARRQGRRAIEWLERFASNCPFGIGPDNGQLGARSEVLAQGRGGVNNSGQAAGDTASLGRENVLDRVHEELLQRRSRTKAAPQSKVIW
jgi:hypothetical protein